MNKPIVSYKNNEDLDHFEAEYFEFRHDVVVEYHGKKYCVSVFSFRKIYDLILRSIRIYGYTNDIPNIIILNQKISCAEIEKVVERLAEVGYFETMCTPEEYVKTESSSLKRPEVSYTNDTQEKSELAKKEGFRDDVLVTLENASFWVTLVTPEKLKKDFDEALEKNGFFVPYHNAIFLKEVTKEEAKIVIDIRHLTNRDFDCFIPYKRKGVI